MKTNRTTSMSTTAALTTDRLLEAMHTLAPVTMYTVVTLSTSPAARPTRSRIRWRRVSKAKLFSMNEYLTLSLQTEPVQVVPLTRVMLRAGMVVDLEAVETLTVVQAVMPTVEGRTTSEPTTLLTLGHLVSDIYYHSDISPTGVYCRQSRNGRHNYQWYCSWR